MGVQWMQIRVLRTEQSQTHAIIECKEPPGSITRKKTVPMACAFLCFICETVDFEISSTSIALSPTSSNCS